MQKDFGSVLMEKKKGKTIEDIGLNLAVLFLTRKGIMFVLTGQERER